GIDEESIHAATIALTQVFGRLYEDGSMERNLRQSKAHDKVATWLIKSQNKFIVILLKNLSHSQQSIQVSLPTNFFVMIKE
ncbi:hypothetical protein HK096_008796, partial [Nowakowskiella sp. JEL0078]